MVKFSYRLPLYAANRAIFNFFARQKIKLSDCENLNTEQFNIFTFNKVELLISISGSEYGLALLDTQQVRSMIFPSFLLAAESAIFPRS